MNGSGEMYGKKDLVYAPATWLWLAARIRRNDDRVADLFKGIVDGGHCHVRDGRYVRIGVTDYQMRCIREVSEDGVLPRQWR
jgi:hypothetical protein